MTVGPFFFNVSCSECWSKFKGKSWQVKIAHTSNKHKRDIMIWLQCLCPNIILKKDPLIKLHKSCKVKMYAGGT